jgi:hypothetical protein
MRVYIAGDSQEKCLEVAEELIKAGHEIISSWLYEEFLRTKKYTPERRAIIASQDESDILDCEALVCVASPDMVPGGKFVEVGLAHGMGKTVFILGRRENMMMWHPSFQHADNVNALVEILAK